MKNLRSALPAIITFIFVVGLLFWPSKNKTDKNAPNLKASTAKCIQLIVDYNLSVDTLIKNGKYSYVCHRAKSKNFPNEKTYGKDTLHGILFRFNKCAPMDSIEKWARDSTSIRPATITEIAALGLEDYISSEDCFILAVGSKELIEGKKYSPLLNTVDHSFRTNSWNGGKWDSKNNLYFYVYK